MYSAGALRLPSSSTRQSFGSASKRESASASARLMAGTTPYLSMYAAEDVETAKRNVCDSCNSTARAKNSSRFFSESFLESFTPSRTLQSKSVGTITAPTATGPASGPRLVYADEVFHLLIITVEKTALPC